EGLTVPEVLLSGDHNKIKDWKKYQSLKNTYMKRPDLLDKYEFSEEEIKIFKKIKEKVEKK
ncbi:MAG TPA: tRNA (guanosine(37)-N1)-methyltransferase TrmD, partial [Schnuerera sp.]|nr:tRNA (guanosine(37)-N1)-methyltransferase TrmD [Schnuerera sp.]